MECGESQLVAGTRYGAEEASRSDLIKATCKAREKMGSEVITSNVWRKGGSGREEPGGG